MMEAVASPEMTRSVAQRWFDALKSGNGAAALACLDDNIEWINNPPDKGLSDIVPWLGKYVGRAAVESTFVIWGQLSEVQQFELVELVIHEDEAIAIVHEVARIKKTGLCYDIEFIQRFKVANDKIIFWKSYWDTVKGIIPFRGDMQARMVKAAQNGDHADMMLVLPFGADPNTIDVQTGQTPLMMAAARGNVDLVRTLLQYGADPNAIDRRAGTSALHKACQGGHLEVVKLLMGSGAFADHQATTTGHTPLIEAIWFKSEEIVDYLLKQGARTELRTYYGFTIDEHIAYALKVNPQPIAQSKLNRIKQLILERRGADQGKIASQKLSQFVLAADIRGVRETIKSGCDLEQRYPIIGSFSDGHTPLLIACRDGHTQIADALIQAGANVNAVEPVFGAVPLHKATYNGYLEIVRLLCKAKGIDLNFQGASNGYTPLHDALWHGFVECADVLIDAGARTDVVAYDGKLPIDLAIEQLGADSPIVGKLRSRP